MKSVFEFKLIVGVNYKGIDDNPYYYDVENEFSAIACQRFLDEFNESFDENEFEINKFIINSSYRVKLIVKANNQEEARYEARKRIENAFKNDVLSVGEIIFAQCNVINDAENMDQMLVKCTETLSTIFSIKAPSTEMAVEYIKDLFFNQEIQHPSDNCHFGFEVLISDASQAKYDGVNYHVVDLQDIEPHSKLCFDDGESEEINLNTKIERNDFRDYPKPYVRPSIMSNYLWKFHNVKVDVILSKIVCVESKDLESAYDGLKSAVIDRISFDEDECEVEVKIIPTDEDANTVVYWDRDSNRAKTIR